MQNLNAEETGWLKEVRDGGLLKKRLPDAIQEKLVSLGLIEMKLGGLMTTPKGNEYLLKKG